MNFDNILLNYASLNQVLCPMHHYIAKVILGTLYITFLNICEKVMSLFVCPPDKKIILIIKLLTLIWCKKQE